MKLKDFIVKNKKNFLLVSLFFSIILIIIFSYFIFLNNNPTKKEEKETSNIEKEIIPTVDSSVEVDLKKIKKGEIVLNIKNSPKNTESIEFEITYKVRNNDNSESENQLVDQGVIGRCYLIKDYWQCGEPDNSGGRKIVLGTCSSGVCRYHNIVGELFLLLKFYGDYGQKIFEKNYSEFIN